MTALHRACLLGRVSVAETLILSGADASLTYKSFDFEVRCVESALQRINLWLG
jgi:hypothetical protein